MRPDQIRAALAQCVRDLEDLKPGARFTSVEFAKSAIEALDKEGMGGLSVLELHAPEDGEPEGYQAPEDAPVLHLNGSDGEVLASGYREAIERLHEACIVLQDTAPHGRDYYVKGPEAIIKATRAHQYRLGALFGTLHQLKALYFDVRIQQEKRKRKA